MSSAAGAAKEAVDELRSRGEAVGLLKLRVFRPFPYRELKTALSHLQAIAVLDRVLVPGSFGGPLFNEVRAALYDLEEKNLPMVFPYIYGLGGRDILTLHIHEVFQDMAKNKEKNEIKTGISFINLRQ
jgi:pyruvate ferredoxin oxidoreductase alpha subunit